MAWSPLGAPTPNRLGLATRRLRHSQFPPTLLRHRRPCEVSLALEVSALGSGEPEPRLVAPSNARPLTAADAGGIHTTGLMHTIARHLWADQSSPDRAGDADRDCTASPKMGKGADRTTIRSEPRAALY